MHSKLILLSYYYPKSHEVWEAPAQTLFSFTSLDHNTISPFVSFSTTAMSTPWFSSPQWKDTCRGESPCTVRQMIGEYLTSVMVWTASASYNLFLFLISSFMCLFIISHKTYIHVFFSSPPPSLVKSLSSLTPPPPHPGSIRGNCVTNMTRRPERLHRLYPCYVPLLRRVQCWGGGGELWFILSFGLYFLRNNTHVRLVCYWHCCCFGLTRRIWRHLPRIGSRLYAGLWFQFSMRNFHFGLIEYPAFHFLITGCRCITVNV